METSIYYPEMNSILIDGSYSLTKLSFPERMDEIGALRIRAWRNEPGIDPIFFAKSTWIESLDKTAHHWVVMKDDAVIAAARMSFHRTLNDIPYISLVPDTYRAPLLQKRLASINRLVVDPEYRGQGLSRLLDHIRIELAMEENIDVIVAQPQLTRLNSLTKLGFTYICELQSTPEMPERPLFFMQLDLNNA